MRKLSFLFFVVSSLNSIAQIKPIGLLPANAHYFYYNGELSVLITPGEDLALL